jgi:dienelactone hydrolase
MGNGLSARSAGTVWRWLLCCIAGLVAATSASASAFRETVVQIPLWPGAQPHALVATAYWPPGDGPFPLVVLNHGSPANGAMRARMGRYRVLNRINLFVERGFAVIVPMRRGYGATGGDWAERYGSCDNADYRMAGQEAAADVLATLRYAQSMPGIDSSRIILAGQSAGGFAVLAAASAQPAGVRAVLNFSGGRGGNPATRPGEPCAPDRIADALRYFGRTTRVPSLWQYADNDRFFAPRHVRDWFAAYRDAGAPSTLIMHPALGEDGHRPFSSADGMPLWTAAMDAFLRDIGWGGRDGGGGAESR